MSDIHSDVVYTPVSAIEHICDVYKPRENPE